MTATTKRVSGIIILTIPSIVYGGYFLLSIISGQQEALQLTEFQRAMFRAGHAHAGVLVILALLMQLFIDHVSLSEGFKWFTRIAFPAAAILISFGFFAAAMGKNVTKPTDLINVLYFGVFVLILALLTTGIGLTKKTITT